MKLKSISGVVYLVSDIAATADFYETLGFRIDTKEADYLKVYLNWFWMEFVRMDDKHPTAFQEEAKLGNKGAGQFVYISVDDVDEAYKELVSKGLKPSGEPKDWPWGRREFVVRDPDGYKLVFFQKTK